MSNARDTILGRIKAATQQLPERASMPAYDPVLSVSKGGLQAADASDLVAHFAEQLKAANGRFASDWATLAGMLQNENAGLGFCETSLTGLLREAWPSVSLETTFERTRVDDYTFSVTWAWGAIAETGTIILCDTASPSRLAALAPWLHVAVIPQERIFATVAEAIAALPDDPSVIFATGPSKTADIEGLLIEGVHGPGIQIALVQTAS